MSSRIFFQQVIFTLLFAGLVGCTGKKQEVSAATNTAKTGKVVNLAIWNNYLSEELQKKFTEKTGIEIKISNYSSNEELLAKIQSGASGIDVAVPSDYMVDIMIKTGLLGQIQHKDVANEANVDSRWLKLSYDPENKYSLPYAWTTTGIAYNKELIKTPPKSWKDFFQNVEYAGKMSLLDDVREVTGAALKMNGASLNSKSPEELKKAETTLLAVRPRVKMFRSDVIESLQNKEIAIAHAYSSDSLQASLKTNGLIEFVVPEEGGTISLDNIVVLKDSKNTAEAHQLINFLLSPEVNVSFVNTIRAGAVLKGTKEKLSAELQKSDVLFPSEAKMKKLERVQDLGDSTKIYEELWTKIKSM